MATKEDVVVGAIIKASDDTAVVIEDLGNDAKIQWSGGRINQHSKRALAEYIVLPDLPKIKMQSLSEILKRM